MALKYSFDSPYQLPKSAADIIPQELGQDFLSSLDQSFQVQEQKQLSDLLGFQEQRGLLHSGDTNRKAYEDVVGPGVQRRQQALSGLALQGAQTGQSQRFQREGDTIAYGRQRQAASEDFDRQLQYLSRQASLQQDLVRLQSELEINSRPGFGAQLLSGLSSGLSGGISGAMGGFARAGAGRLFSQGSKTAPEYSASGGGGGFDSYSFLSGLV